VRASSSSTRTPTSMEERKVRFTMAASTTTEPTWQGRRKWTASPLAVTHGPCEKVLAASPAQMSIQLSTVPPCRGGERPPLGRCSGRAAGCAQW
jgi:hypothetical protein